MAILSKGTTFAANDQVTATKLNNLVDAATFDSTGAVDNSTTQLSSGAIIVKDGGITPAKLSTGGPSWTSGGILSASSFSGNVDASILEVDLIKIDVETGYATSGTVTLDHSSGSNAIIQLGGATTFASTGLAAGQVLTVALKNSTGAPINMTWPAWTQAGGSFPATLTAGQAMVLKLYSYGTTTSDVYAVSSL